MSMWTDESVGDGPADRMTTTDDGDAMAPDDLLAPTGAGEEWTPDQGYPDSSLSVRIWVDDDKRLTKVRISNRWRDRARGTSLSSMFDEAFLLANATLGSSTPPVGDVPDDGGPADALSWDSLDAILAETTRLTKEAAALDQLPPDEVIPNRWVGSPVEGHSANQMVAVRLSIHGRTEKVAFSDQWLRQARVAEVCDAVLEAHRDAYAQFVPPVFEPGDRQRLADAYARLQNQSMALLAAPPAPQGGPR
jgi:hypothetical protein